MLASTMFNVAYGLECESDDDPRLVRLEKLVAAIIKSALPSQFLVVSILLSYTHDESFEFSNLLEHSPTFEAPSFLDAWWFVQEVG
jgi:hypothetical protein